MRMRAKLVVGLVFLSLRSAASQAVPPLRVVEPDRAAMVIAVGSIRSIRATFSATPSLKKDEFETTDQFAMRSRGALERQYIAARFEANCNIGWTYDADKQIMKTFLLMEKAEGDRNYSVPRLDCHRVQTGTHEATNGFGAKTLVKEVVDTVYGIRPLMIDDVAPVLAISVYMPPDTARLAKPDLALIAMFRPIVDGSGRVIIEESGYSAATMSLPTELVTRRHILNVDRDAEIWVINKKTGTVYRKIKLAKPNEGLCVSAQPWCKTP